jgi:topoisomerase-4 subunit B
MAENQYTEDNIRSLDWKEHIRLRPGMYIGKLGDGSSLDDGIYVLIKEVIDNSIDEFVMGNGRHIDVKIEDNKVHINCEDGKPNCYFTVNAERKDVEKIKVEYQEEL